MKHLVSKSLVFAMLLALVASIAAGSESSLADTGAKITLRGYLCPSSFDGKNASIKDLDAACITPASGTTIQVTDGFGSAYDSTLDGDGQSVLTNIPSGDVSLNEMISVNSYARVFCSLTPGNTSPQPTPTQEPAATPVAETPSEQGESMVSQADTETPIESEESVPAEAPADPSTTAEGTESELLRQVSKVAEYANPFSVKLLAGDQLSCSFYNLKLVPAAGVLNLSVLSCPEGTDLSSGIGKKAKDPVCKPQPGITFTLGSYDNKIQPESMTTSPDGRATWDGLPVSSYTLTETLPAKGYATPVVFCSIGKVEDQPGTNQREVSNQTSSPSISFDLKDGETATCTWFNVDTPAPSPTPTPPGNNGNGGNGGNDGNGGNAAHAPTASGPASLKLTIRTCPANYDALSDDADFNRDCTKTGDNGSFALTGENGADNTQTANGDNEVLFAPLGAGEYLLTESFPSGIASAFIGSCTSNLVDASEYAFALFARIDTSGEIGLQLRAGEQLACDWFDVPTGDTAGATVTITLLACPGQSITVSQCEPGPAGVEFQFTPNGDTGNATSLTTDANGIASGQVEPGSYELEEMGSNWCAADSPGFDAGGNLNVDTSDLDVSIYNCGG